MLSLCQIIGKDIFSFLFTQIMVSFAPQLPYPLYCMWSQLLTVGLNVSTTRVLFRKCFPVPMSSSIFPTFFFVQIRVLGFMLRSLTAHLYFMREETMFIFLNVKISLILM